MVKRAVVFLVSSASAILVFGCDAGNPFEPRTAPSSVHAVKVGTSTTAAINTSAVAAPTQIDVAWEDNATDETRFEIHRSATGPTGTFTLLGTAAANVVTYSDVGAEVGTTYCYKVRGVRVNGKNVIYSLFSNTACATITPPPPVITAPAAPSNAQANVSSTGINFGWQDNSSDETSFEVHRSTTGSAGTFTLLTSVAANVTGISDDGLAYATEYCYTVRAVKTVDTTAYASAFSNTVCATTPAAPVITPPAAPSNAAAYAYSTRIAFGWQDNSSDETSFEVHRSTTGETGNFTLLTSLAANVTSIYDEGLASAAQYCYKVRAVKAVETSSYASAFSNTVCATTPAAPSGAPPAPTDLNAWPASSYSIYFEFTASTVKTDGFRLYRSTDNGASWTMYWTATGGVYTSDPPMVITFLDNNRQPEQRVCYRVVSYNASGDSPPSNVDCTTPPAAPTPGGATRVDDQTVDVSWVDNSSVEDTYYISASYNSCTVSLCSADNIGGALFFPALPANSTSYRCTNCPATIVDEESGVTMYLLGFEIYVTSDGGRSNSLWIPAR